MSQPTPPQRIHLDSSLARELSEPQPDQSFVPSRLFWRIASTCCASVVLLGIPGSEALGKGVEAVIAAPNSDSAATTLEDGSQVYLADGTYVRALCYAPGYYPSALRAQVKSGPYAGSIATAIPRFDLDNVTDPFRADPIGQDPFGPLDSCTR